MVGLSIKIWITFLGNAGVIKVKIELGTVEICVCLPNGKREKKRITLNFNSNANDVDF